MRLTLHAILEELQVAARRRPVCPVINGLVAEGRLFSERHAGGVARMDARRRAGDAGLSVSRHAYRVLAFGPRFDVRKTPAAIGLIPEVFRRTAGVRRSLDPDFSIAALGAEAAGIVAHRPGDEDPFSGDIGLRAAASNVTRSCLASA